MCAYAFDVYLSMSARMLACMYVCTHVSIVRHVLRIHACMHACMRVGMCMLEHESINEWVGGWMGEVRWA